MQHKGFLLQLGDDLLLILILHTSPHSLLSLSFSALVVVLCDLKYLKLPCELTAMKRSVLFATLALFWFATALILTYRGPFYSGLTGNGYLGSWTAPEGGDGRWSGRFGGIR